MNESTCVDALELSYYCFDDDSRRTSQLLCCFCQGDPILTQMLLALHEQPYVLFAYYPLTKVCHSIQTTLSRVIQWICPKHTAVDTLSRGCWLTLDTMSFRETVYVLYSYMQYGTTCTCRPFNHLFWRTWNISRIAVSILWMQSNVPDVIPLNVWPYVFHVTHPGGADLSKRQEKFELACTQPRFHSCEVKVTQGFFSCFGQGTLLWSNNMSNFDTQWHTNWDVSAIMTVPKLDLLCIPSLIGFIIVHFSFFWYICTGTILAAQQVNSNIGWELCSKFAYQYHAYSFGGFARRSQYLYCNDASFGSLMPNNADPFYWWEYRQ